MHAARYLPPLGLMAATWISLWVGGAWMWFIPAFSFIAIPVLDQLHPGSTTNPTDEVARERAADWRYAAPMVAIVLLQPALIVFFLALASRGTWAPGEWLAATFTLGTACGAFGINVGHELGHRREARWQLGAKILLLTSLYQHFFIEHNRGHHRRVATPDDPATGRRGETVYAFWLRSVPGGVRSAWELEATRLAGVNRPAWSWNNQLLRFAAVQTAAVGTSALTFGGAATAAWVVAAAMGALLLETINYVEHYGLVRQRREHGAYERVQPHHSWNSNRTAGRMLLFELTRHADHHAHADRPYPALRHHDAAPELPFGYPAMVLLALAPPVFMAVMHPALDAQAA